MQQNRQGKLNTDCWVACFDLLGFRNKIKNLKKPNSLEAEVNVFFKETLEKAKKGVKRHQELLPNIQYGFYSDTFFFYISVDETGHSYTVIDSLARQFFVECIWSRDPLCGALSVGLFYAEKKENIYIGPALIDAYEYAEKQNWIGLVITPKACCKLKEYDFKPFDNLAYTAYDVPVKEKKKFEYDKITIPFETENLFSYKHYRLGQVENCINQIKKEAENRKAGQSILFRYENTIKFINDTQN